MGRVGLVGLFGLLVACGGSTVIGSSGTGGEGGAAGSTSATGGSSSTTANEPPAAVGGSSGEGGSTFVWENDCAMTGIAVDKGFGPVILLDSVCPDDFWSEQHYEGATAYEYIGGGFTGELDFRACDAAGDRRIVLNAFLDGTGTLMLDGGRYTEMPGEDYELTAGTLDVTVDGEVGQVVEGSYQGTFAPVQNDGPPIQLTGPVRACHLPTFAAP